MTDDVSGLTPFREAEIRAALATWDAPDGWLIYRTDARDLLAELDRLRRDLADAERMAADFEAGQTKLRAELDEARGDLVREREVSENAINSHIEACGDRDDAKAIADTLAEALREILTAHDERRKA